MLSLLVGLPRRPQYQSVRRRSRSTASPTVTPTAALIAILTVALTSPLPPRRLLRAIPRCRSRSTASSTVTPTAALIAIPTVALTLLSPPRRLLRRSPRRWTSSPDFALLDVDRCAVHEPDAPTNITYTVVMNNDARSRPRTAASHVPISLSRVLIKMRVPLAISLPLHLYARPNPCTELCLGFRARDCLNVCCTEPYINNSIYFNTGVCPDRGTDHDSDPGPNRCAKRLSCAMTGERNAPTTLSTPTPTPMPTSMPTTPPTSAPTLDLTSAPS